MPASLCPGPSNFQPQMLPWTKPIRLQSPTALHALPMSFSSLLCPAFIYSRDDLTRGYISATQNSRHRLRRAFTPRAGAAQSFEQPAPAEALHVYLHSMRNICIGSIRDALHAGSRHANAATARSDEATAMNTNG